MKKLNYLAVLVSFLILSCSKDSSSETVLPATYSIAGFWKTTSAVLNGVEKFGGTNPVKSELYNFNVNGVLSTQSYSDANYTTVISYSTGGYTLLNASTINMWANAYNTNGTLLSQYNFSCQIQLINATNLEIKILNYPAANDVYIKKFIR
jgi:hypothetical protein